MRVAFSNALTGVNLSRQLSAAYKLTPRRASPVSHLRRHCLLLLGNRRPEEAHVKLASLLSLVLTAGAVTVFATGTAAQAAPGVTPPNVSLALGPGQSADVAKHVETAPVPPKPDIV